MKFGLMRMKLQCVCGGEISDSFTAIGITSYYQIYLAGKCPWCDRKVLAVKPLEEIVDDCSAIPAPEKQGFTSDDVKELHDMKITLEDS